MLRLTKEIIQKILMLNEGFSRITNYSSRNYKAEYHYIIKGGNLIIQKISKTSWADSKMEYSEMADIEQTRRFIKKYLDCLNLGDLLHRKED